MHVCNKKLIQFNKKPTENEVPIESPVHKYVFIRRVAAQAPHFRY